MSLCRCHLKGFRESISDYILSSENVFWFSVLTKQWQNGKWAWSHNSASSLGQFLESTLPIQCQDQSWFPRNDLFASIQVCICFSTIQLEFKAVNFVEMIYVHAIDFLFQLASLGLKLFFLKPFISLWSSLSADIVRWYGLSFNTSNGFLFQWRQPNGGNRI